MYQFRLEVEEVGTRTYSTILYSSRLRDGYQGQYGENVYSHGVLHPLLYCQRCWRTRTKVESCWMKGIGKVDPNQVRSLTRSSAYVIIGTRSDMEPMRTQDRKMGRLYSNRHTLGCGSVQSAGRDSLLMKIWSWIQATRKHIVI